MNTADIKRIFYQRYEQSDSFLHYSFQGAGVYLLGHPSVTGAPFLGCTISMGVGTLARELGSSYVKLQSADSDRGFIYEIGTPPSLLRGKEREAARLLFEVTKNTRRGAELLYRSTIPAFMPFKRELSLSVARALASVYGEQPTPHKLAYTAADGHIEPYLMGAYAKSGYSTLISGGNAASYPLPMTGYKLILARLKTRVPSHADKIYAAMENIRARFPSASSPADLTLAHAAAIKNKTVSGYIRHMAEEKMYIDAAVRGLSRCDIKPLFRAMNASQASMSHYGWVGGEAAYFASLARKTDGVRAARCSGSSIVIIAETDAVDYVLRMTGDEFEYNAGYRPPFCVADTI